MLSFSHSGNEISDDNTKPAVIKDTVDLKVAWTLQMKTVNNSVASTQKRTIDKW